MEGAERLGTKYGKYCYLMAIDTEEFVYSFTEVAPAPTDAEYFAKVRELHDASVAIGECSLACELFKLVRVDTSEATNVRISRVNVLTDGIWTWITLCLPHAHAK